MFRRAVFILTAAAIASTSLFGILTQSAGAAPPPVYLANTVRDAAITSTERNSFAICLSHLGVKEKGKGIFDGAHRWSLTPDEVANYDWFGDKNANVKQWNSYAPQKDSISCNQLDVHKILNDLGWTSGVEAACDLGFTRGKNCSGGSGEYRWPTKQSGGTDVGGLAQVSALSKADVLKKIDAKYNGTVDFGKDYTPEQYYVMAMNVLMNAKTCNATPLSLVSDGTADDKAKSNDQPISVVDGKGKITKQYFNIQGPKDITWMFRNGTGDSSLANFGGNCKTMIDIVNDNATAYATWVTKHPEGSRSSSGSCSQYGKDEGGDDQAAVTQLTNACNNGLENRETANYCQDKYVGADAVELRRACTFGHDTAVDPNASADGSDDGVEANTECAIAGIGWAICPAMEFMATMADGAYTFLATWFLETDAGAIEAARSSWEKFRDIANVAFVIALLVIIYSQLTSFGLNNYGIKKMLPKLVVAALLVNLSFFVCQLAVDVTNILGYALPNLINSTVKLGGGTMNSDSSLGQDIGGMAISWVSTIAGVLVGTSVIALTISVPVLVAGLLAIALIVFILIARQAIIVLLIVVAPLAFVAYLLPNTEQWFKKWYKTFGTMLLLFPIVGVVFGASQLAANVIYNASKHGLVDMVTALAITSLPFFVVPGLLKGSLNALGSIGKKAQSLANKSTGNVGKKLKTSTKLGTGLSDMAKFRDQKRAIKYAKGRGRGLMGAIGRIPGVGDRSGKYNEKARLRANSLDDQEYEEDVKAAMESQKMGVSYDDKMKIATGDIPVKTEAERDAAIRYMLERGNLTERRQVYNSLNSMTGKQRHNAIDMAFSKGDGGLFGSSVLGKIQGMTSEELGSSANVEKMLDDGFAAKMNAMGIKGDMFHKDEYTAKFIEEQLNGVYDENGTLKKPPNTAISADKREAFAKSLNNFALTDQGRRYGEDTDTGAIAERIIARETDATKLPMSVVNPNGVPQGGSLPGGGATNGGASGGGSGGVAAGGNAGGTPPPPPPNTPPSAPPPPPPPSGAVSGTNNNQGGSTTLTIPHAQSTNSFNTTPTNSNNSRQGAPQGTSGFGSRPSGLLVPRSASGSATSPSSNTPPPPPPNTTP